MGSGLGFKSFRAVQGSGFQVLGGRGPGQSRRGFVAPRSGRRFADSLAAEHAIILLTREDRSLATLSDCRALTLTAVLPACRGLCSGWSDVSSSEEEFEM